MAEVMRYYIVTASWNRESCWECEGSTGQAFVYVRAHDGKEAVEMARERLMPAPYGQTRAVVATELALPASPQARKALRVGEGEMAIRARAYITELKPEQTRG